MTEFRQFEEYLTGWRHYCHRTRKSRETFEATWEGDSNDAEHDAGVELAEEVELLMDRIAREQDAVELLKQARAAAEAMNAGDRQKAMAGAALLKEVFLDLDDFACRGELPDEWTDAFIATQEKAQAAENRLKVLGLNGDGDPVCPVCDTLNSIVAEVTKIRRRHVEFSDGTVTLVKPPNEIKPRPAVGYQCAVCFTPVALPSHLDVTP